jgi:lysophospholipase L1-like esterase
MSGQIDDGGPAFPVPGLQSDESFNGMSLRDYFATYCDIGAVDDISVSAGVALVGTPKPNFKTHPVECLQWRADVRASLRYLEADAMLLVYKGDHAHSRHVLPAGVITSLFLEDPVWFSQVEPESLRGRRFSPDVWRILFHQDAAVAYHHLDAFGHAVRPPSTGETPARSWLAYGSSITYGASAFHPSNSYTQHAAHLLGVDVLNKGLPGSCMCEPEMAEWLAALPGWDFATLELGVNLVDWATPAEFEERARHLITTIHQARPDALLHVINIFPNRADAMLDRSAIPAVRTPLFNQIVPRLVEEIGHPNVHFIDGRMILVQPACGLNADLLHPSDEGHLAMGRALAEHLSEIP